MKKVYSIIMMLAMMVATLALTACSSSNNEDDGFDESGFGDSTSMSVHLSNAGTLSSMISKSQASELLRLKLSGHIDARDFDFIKWDCMKIREVDLSEVIIDSYSGLEGTEEGNNKTYAANEIPSGAFFYWKDVHKYVYDGMPVDEGMASLRKIVLPKGVKAIRRNAFARAYNLTEINIPDGVESIDYVAFAICTSLEEIKLPASLKTVGKLAFADMKRMKRFYINSPIPPVALSDSFQGIPSNAVLYVPQGSESNYMNATGWKTFTKINGNANTAYEENDNTDSTSSFSITYDGQRNYVENVEWLNPHFGNGGYNKGNYFCLDNYPLVNGQIHIIFPFSQYGKNVQPSYFQVGYSDFGKDATDIEFISVEMSGWYGEYVSGSAKVIKNSGSSITLQFSNYQFEVSRREKTHEFILNGALEFKNYMYN